MGKAKRIFLPALLLAVSLCSALAQPPLERGNYLVNGIMACGNCHTPKDASGQPIAEKEFSGGLSFTTPAFNAVAANITPDRETGIGDWSDDEIKRALIDGSRPNHGRLAGTPLAAVMPAGFYKALLPPDLDAVVAYLRSVKPLRNEVKAPEYKQPVHRDAYADAEKGFMPSDMTDPVRHGAYLATIGHCMECHSAWSRGISDFERGLGKGGRPFGTDLVQGYPASWQGSVAPNITSHKEKGIGAWTDGEIKRAITQAVRRDGTALKRPMAYEFYARMSDADLNGIVAWLRTVPPLD
jgi:mono/diheme cytochrome c family protein